MGERDTTADNDPQTGTGDVWGDEFVDTADREGVDNQPGSQEPPARPRSEDVEADD